MIHLYFFNFLITVYAFSIFSAFFAIVVLGHWIGSVHCSPKLATMILYMIQLHLQNLKQYNVHASGTRYRMPRVISLTTGY